MLDKITSKAQLVIAGVLCVLVFFGGIKYQELRLSTIPAETVITQEKVTSQEEEKPKPEEREPRMLTVHVVGAVEKPGLYTLEEGKRVGDAVELAVPQATADLALINMAASLLDGRQIYVPFKGQKTAAPSGPALDRLGTQDSGLININTAGAKDLEKLPGIGPALAQRIIDYRESKGHFTRVEDITKVSGIGPAILEKIKSKVSVD